jgi:Ca2+/Na+ antiporter
MINIQKLFLILLCFILFLWHSVKKNIKRRLQKKAAQNKENKKKEKKSVHKQEHLCDYFSFNLFPCYS